MARKSVLARLDRVVDDFCNRTRYFQEDITKGRARMFALQHRLNTRQRNSVLKLKVATNCPDWDTRIAIIKACSEEVIADHAHGGGKAHWEILEELGMRIGLARKQIRADPPLHYASGGNGSQHHLTMERLKTRAGINLVHIPYRGGSPAATATVAGEVSVTMSGTSSAPQIRAGRLRALAFTGRQRSAVLPDVPTVAELYPDFTMVQWYGLFAAAGTPETVIAQLRTEVNKALVNSEVKERLRNAGGIEAWITTPEEFAAVISAEFVSYGKLVREVGAKLD